MSAERPFYDCHADAYDALITDPVEPWVDTVHDRLVKAGLFAAQVLDAGCGTGRHAKALTGYGHRVTLLDASPKLLQIAQERCPGADAWQTDLCSPALNGRSFDAVMCRGVLNDLVLDEERASVFDAFSALCERGGLLFLDVRDAATSVTRADGEVRRKTAALPDGSSLVFTSSPRWERGLIIVDETYELVGESNYRTVHEYQFVMRPWTADELRNRLSASGFHNVEISAGVGRRTNDRLFVVAERQ